MLQHASHKCCCTQPCSAHRRRCMPPPALACCVRHHRLAGCLAALLYQCRGCHVVRDGSCAFVETGQVPPFSPANGLASYCGRSSLYIRPCTWRGSARIRIGRAGFQVTRQAAYPIVLLFSSLLIVLKCFLFPVSKLACPPRVPARNSTRPAGLQTDSGLVSIRPSKF